MTQCSIDDCTNNIQAKEMCSKHYKRMSRTGKINCLVDFHGDSKTSLHRIWNSIKQRCHNPRDKNYDRYGKRGISLEPKFHLYSTFKKHVMSLDNASCDGYELDRKDNDDGYFDGNIRWITHKDNCNNQERSIKTRFSDEEISEIIECYKNSDHTILSISVEVGISKSSMQRILKGSYQ